MKQQMRSMMVVLITTLFGLTLLWGVFVNMHPYFNPTQSSALPDGWIDELNYISERIKLSKGTTVVRYLRYQGPLIPSIVILGVEPIEVENKGRVKLIINGFLAGTVDIESKEKYRVTMVSGCSVALLKPDFGYDLGNNLIWVGSEGFEGQLRYFLELPKEGLPV